MTDYPMLRLLERHGNWLAIAVAAMPPAAAIVAVAQGFSMWWLVAGLAAGAFLYGAIRSYVELIQVMIDMLLPK